MRWIDLLWRRLRALTRSSAVDADLRDEMQAHLDQLIQQNIESGMSPGDARTAALREFGGVAAIVDDSRDERGIEWGHRAWREIRWAWRGVRARGWRAVFVVAILSVALTANASMFAVVDSLLFNPFPFPALDRIVSINGKTAASERMTAPVTAELLKGWRVQSDTVAAAGGYMTKTIFVMHEGSSQRVRTADITVGTLEVLGVKPRWGRTFIDADVQMMDGFGALISEPLARRLFGSPKAALGGILRASGPPLVIVGVMPSDFAFPDASYHVWRALDPAGPLARSQGLTAMARLRPGVTPAMFAERAPVVGRLAGLTTYSATASPFFAKLARPGRQTLLLVLLGAAFCLLLAACASVMNLELTHGIRRAQVLAVQLSLGASRRLLARTMAYEGLILISISLAAGLGTAALTIAALSNWLPRSLKLATGHPLALDWRVAAFTAAAAIVSWFFAASPAIAGALRSDVRSLLNAEGRSATGSRGAGRLRRWLTAIEIALATALIVGGLLYARSYQQLLSVAKGFESGGLAEVSFSMPAAFFSGSESRREFTARIVREVAAQPGVRGVTNAALPPSMGDSPSSLTLAIDGDTPVGPLLLGRKWIDPAFFQVVGLPLIAGRTLVDGDSLTDVVISESLARRLWPNTSAVGHTLRLSSRQQPCEVVGVVADFRTAATRMPDPSDDRFFLYTLWAPIPIAATSLNETKGPAIDTGGSFSLVTVGVRLDSPMRLPELTSDIRRLHPSIESSITLVDDLYAEQDTDTRVASQIVGAFSVLAFVVAIAGVYGVMSFLVAGRRREIGIRMVLGADPRVISRMILSSSVQLVLIGVAVGSLISLIAGIWIKSQLFGVSPTDPRIFGLVAGTVAVVALLASWQPAHHAARIDPAIALRAD